MIKRLFVTAFIINFFYFSFAFSSENEIYKKIDLFGEVLEKINKEYVDEINQSESMDSAINGLLQSLDPYSSYMSPEIYNEMQTETSGEFGGLGIEVSMESGVVKVISPIDDTPASKAGIKAGDYIVKINDTQVQGKSLLEAVKLMRGPVGTSIDLTIRRKNVKKPLEFKIVRKIIEVQSVSAKLLGEDKNLGYIRLKSFNENSDKQVLKSVKEFEKSGTCLLHVARDDKRMAAVKDALNFFAPDIPIKIFPSWDCLPYDRISPNSGILASRLSFLTDLAQDTAQKFIILTTVNAAMQRVPTRSILSSATFQAQVGQRIDLNKLYSFLNKMGFSKKNVTGSNYS